MDDDVRVLHVDDEPDFAELAATYLEREIDGVTVETATSVAAGLDRLDERVDCVVSDYDMPGSNGIEFLEAVRADRPDFPFILYTGKGSEEIASEAISAGVTDYLQKERGTDQYTVLANRIENAVTGHRARTAVEESRARLRETYERITDGFFAVDSAWRYTYVNDEGARLVGRSREELLDRTVWEAFPGLEGTAFESALRTAMQTRETTSLREYFPPHDTWYDVRIYSDEDGISIFFSDVTDHRRRERELERYETLFESIDDVVFVVDEDRTVELVNEAVTEYVDVPVAEIEGTPIDAFEDDFAADRAEARLFQRIVDRWFATDRTETPPERVEVPLDLPPGPVVFEYQFSPIVEDGGVDAVAVSMREVTDRKGREETITSLHRVASELAACETRQDVYERTIDAAESLLAYDQAAIVEEDDGYLHVEAMSSDLPLDEHPSFTVDEGIAGRTYQTGETHLIDDVATVEDAKPQADNMRAAISVPIGDRGVFQVIDDEPGTFDENDCSLTELLVKHTESALERLDRTRELERRNERLDEFASIVSHDLRNPLSVAAGRLELAREECESDHLDDVAHAHQRMRELLDDLLTLSRAGKVVDELSTVDLASVVTSCWRTVDSGDATLDCPADLRFEADESRLTQLLENLFENAITYGGDAVAITVDALDHRQGFAVEDDGPGIPPDERDRVFDGGYTSAESGTGLGLAIASEIADAHGWSIEVTAGEVGGARFEISDVNVVS